MSWVTIRKDQILKATSIEYDILIVGGGATGLGIAVDAASRGLKVLLLESNDYAKGTSSRSTKLVHGGVRYLAQGNIKLVREALKERSILLQNAPHVTKTQSFIVPVYSLWQKFFYGTGLKIYDWMSGKWRIGTTNLLSYNETIEALPWINTKGLVGGIEYFDGQFDDSRLCIDLMKTAEIHGAVLLNYARVERLIKNEQKVIGVEVYDVHLKETFCCSAKVVVNATGVFVDHLLQQDTVDHAPLVAPSQGIHIVVDKKYFPGNHALMIPKTDDGRVLFVVPWLDKAVIGTTDTPVQSAQAEPIAFKQEIDFVLQHVSRYSKSPISKAEVLSVFAGLRPLVKSSNSGGPTSLLSRDHTIMVNPSGLITITGGKWTTYRKMAKDAVENALFVAKLGKKPCVTEHLTIHNKQADQLYQALLQRENGLEKMHESYPYVWADIDYAVLHEQAQTIEDVLARRTRFLFLDATVTKKLIEPTAQRMQLILDWSEEKLQEEINHMKELVSCYTIQ